MKDSCTHSFWQNNQYPIAIAHRGGDALGTEKENSFAAVEAAVKLGYTWFETDVVATSDDVLLATHGRGFQAHPNKDLPSRRHIRLLSYAEAMEKLIVGGEPPATLAELITSFPGTKWFIDIKTRSGVKPLIKILKNSAIDLDRLSIGGVGIGSQKRARDVFNEIEKARGERICMSLNPFGEASYALLAASDVKVERLETRDRLALKLFRTIGRLPDLDKYMKTVKCGSIHVPYRWINYSTNFVELAHKYGLRVVTWTVNQSEDIEISIKAGVDGIMSDNVVALKRAVLKHSPTNRSLTKQPS